MRCETFEQEVSQQWPRALKKHRLEVGSGAAVSEDGSGSSKTLCCANCLAGVSPQKAITYNDIGLPTEAVQMLRTRFRETTLCPACAKVLPLLGSVMLETNRFCREYYGIWEALLRRDYSDGLPACDFGMLSAATFRHGCHVAYDLDYRVKALGIYLFESRATGKGPVLACVKKFLVDTPFKRPRHVVDDLAVSATAIMNAEVVSLSHIMLFKYFTGGVATKAFQATFALLFIVEHCCELVPGKVLQSAATALECCGTTDWGAALVMNQVLQQHFLRDASLPRTEIADYGEKGRVHTTFSSIVFFASPLSRLVRRAFMRASGRRMGLCRKTFGDCEVRKYGVARVGRYRADFLTRASRNAWEAAQLQKGFHIWEPRWLQWSSKANAREGGETEVDEQVPHQVLAANCADQPPPAAQNVQHARDDVTCMQRPHRRQRDVKRWRRSELRSTTCNQGQCKEELEAVTCLVEADATRRPIGIRGTPEQVLAGICRFSHDGFPASHYTYSKKGMVIARARSIAAKRRAEQKHADAGRNAVRRPFWMRGTPEQVLAGVCRFSHDGYPESHYKFNKKGKVMARARSIAPQRRAEH